MDKKRRPRHVAGAAKVYVRNPRSLYISKGEARVNDHNPIILCARSKYTVVRRTFECLNRICLLGVDHIRFC